MQRIPQGYSLGIPTYNFESTKGQLISKCPFGFTVWTKIPTKLFLDFCPEIFCSFLGGFLEAFWASWGLSK